MIDRPVSQFGDWFTWCQSCRHGKATVSGICKVHHVSIQTGGHASHLLHWFSLHSDCPVTGCSCRSDFHEMKHLNVLMYPNYQVCSSWCRVWNWDLIVSKECSTLCSHSTGFMPVVMPPGGGRLRSPMSKGLTSLILDNDLISRIARVRSFYIYTIFMKQEVPNCDITEPWECRV